MAVRPLVRWPDKRLRSVARPVDAIDDDIRAIWDDMIDTMGAMPGHGVGLAAPQIGVSLRLAVVDAGPGPGRAIRLANPEIVAAGDAFNAHEEASPNLPGVSAKIIRPAKVSVAYTDHHGMRVRKEFDGLWAASVQHQIDHLDGRMYFDNLGKVRRDMLLRRARKEG